MAEQQKSAAERDAEYLENHPVEGVKVLVGAAMTGAAKAADHAIQDAAETGKKLIEPGDMKIEHSPHPVNTLKAAVDNLTTPGSMNLADAPHPVDRAMDAAQKKADEIRQAGVVQGTVIGAEAIVGSVFDAAGPKKIKVLEEGIEVAADLHKGGELASKVHQGEVIADEKPWVPYGERQAKREANAAIPDGEFVPVAEGAARYPAHQSSAREGELLPAANAGAEKSLANVIRENLPAHQAESPSRLQQVGEAISSPFKTIVDKIDPPAPETRLNRVAYEAKPTMMDNLNGQAKLLNEEHALQTARAQQIAAAIKDGPPDVSQRLGKIISSLDDKQIKELLSTDKFDDMLGISKGPRQLQQNAPHPGEDKLVSGFESPGQVQERSALSKAAEYILPQNPSKEQLGKFASELEQGNFGNALKMQAQSVVKGWAGLGGSAIVATTVVVNQMNSKQEDELAKLPPNERLARAFEASAGHPQREKEHPELKPAYDEYHKSVEAALKKHPTSDGQTSNEASSEIFRAKQEIFNDIKQHGLDKNNQRSSVDSLTPDQKVAAAAQFIQTLPEHQRGAYQEKVAEYANKAGLAVTETRSHELQQEQAPQRT